MRSTGANAGWGAGEWLVVEADESDRSLLKLSPRIAVLTNAELDHHTTYSSRRDVDDTFRDFLALAARAVVWDRPDLLALAGDTAGDALRRARARAGGDRLALRAGGVPVSLPVPGAHNAPQRGRGADARAGSRGRTSRPRRRALADFRGAGRRFERLGTTAARRARRRRLRPPPDRGRARRSDAARTLDPGRVVAVFQPHLFSRTRHQHREFGAALARADRRRGARRLSAPASAPRTSRASPGGSSRPRPPTPPAGRPVAWLPGFDAAEAYLRSVLREGDLLLTLGAGDVDALGRRLLG